MLVSNNRNSFVLYDWLKGTGENVYYYSRIMTKEQICFLRPSVIISYNYSHIVKKEIIDMVHGKIINMHISLLPWNRGSNPNFWSFIDNTSKGVTIHLLDKDLDTGDIIAQKEVFFDEKRIF